MYVPVTKPEELLKYEPKAKTELIGHPFMGPLVIFALFMIYSIGGGLNNKELWQSVYDHLSWILIITFVLGIIFSLWQAYYLNHTGHFFVARADPKTLTEDSMVDFTAVTNMPLHEIRSMLEHDNNQTDDIVLLIGTTKRRGSWAIRQKHLKTLPPLQACCPLPIRIGRMYPWGPPALELYAGKYTFPIDLYDIFHDFQSFTTWEDDQAARNYLARLPADARKSERLENIEEAWRARIRTLVIMALKDLEVLADPSVTKKSEWIQNFRITHAELLRDLLADQPDVSFMDIIEKLCQQQLPEIPKPTNRRGHDPLIRLPEEQKAWFLSDGTPMPKLGFRTQRETLDTSARQVIESVGTPNADSTEAPIASS